MSNQKRTVRTMKHQPGTEWAVPGPNSIYPETKAEQYSTIDDYIAACHPDAQEIQTPRHDGEPTTVRYFVCKSVLGRADYIRACWEEEGKQDTTP